MQKIVTTVDDMLQIFSARDLESSVLARIPKGVDLQLDEPTTVEGREWMQAMLNDGTFGFVLAPSARGHTTLASEPMTPARLPISVATDDQTHKQRDPLAGVGGWLIVLLIGLFVSPLLTVIWVPTLDLIWTHSWFLVSVIGGGALAGCSVFVAVALLNRWPTAPGLARALLAISWLFWTGLYVITGLTNLAGSAALSIVGTLIWARYFQVSWRVHVTYGPMPVGRIRPLPAAVIGTTTAIVVCLISVAFANSRERTLGEAWVYFQSLDGVYSVTAPGAGKTSTSADGSAQVIFGGLPRTFAVITSSVAPESGSTRAYAEKLRDKAIAMVEGSITGSSPITYDAYSGLEFSATFAGEQAKGYGSIWQVAGGELLGKVYYRAGSKAFMLLVTGPQGGRTTSDAERFFRSFHIARSQ
jgi:hypothetical protein